MSTPQELAGQMAQKTDQQLLDMVARPAYWIPRQLDAAKAELQKRNITPEPNKELAAQMAERTNEQLQDVAREGWLPEALDAERAELQKRNITPPPPRQAPPPPAADTSFVPVVVRVYGMIIMVLQAVGIVLYGIATLVALVVGLVHPFVSRLAFVPAILIAGALIIGGQIVIFRLGKGLRAGERQAVYGWSILGGLFLLVGIGFLLTGDPGRGIAILFTVAIFHVPPIVSAFRHWTSFK